MPSGAKKRKAAKKKQQAAPQINVSTQSIHENDDPRGQDDGVSSQASRDHENRQNPLKPDEESVKEVISEGSYGEAIEVDKERRPEESIEMGDSSPEHDKSSSSSSSGDSSSSSSSSDDETQETEKTDAPSSCPNADEVIVLKEEDQKAQVISDEKETEWKPLPVSDDISVVSEGLRESEAPISDVQQAPARPLGIAQRTSFFSCCGLFDVITGSSR